MGIALAQIDVSAIPVPQPGPPDRRALMVEIVCHHISLLVLAADSPGQTWPQLSPMKWTLIWPSFGTAEFPPLGSEERRLEPQITIGLLTDVSGFPLMIEAFEGNKAETRTMLPVITAFMAAHQLADVTVVADAGMISEANQAAIEVAGLSFILGTRIPDDQRVHRAAGRSSLHRLEEALTGRPEAAAKPSADEVESQYVEIALRSVLQPVNLDELPIERVIEFRGTHEPELRAFHDHVFDLRKEILTICQIADAEEIQYRLRDLYKSRTEPELEDLQEQLRKFGIRSVLGFFQLRIDKDTAIQTIGSAAAMAGAHILLGPAAPVVVPFAISAVAVPYVRRRRQEKERLEHKSPASLLLALKRELVDDAAGS